MTAKDLLGQKIGPYHIESILGSGGMAVVYQARDPENQVIALKVLFPPPGTGAEILTRFEREARTAARLNHPGIVRVFAVGRAAGYAYMAMTLVEGQTLTTRLAQVGKLDETIAADIAWQIADALYYAHRQGVVHRDVKSSNILLTSDGRALLTDFGVAQALDDASLTRTGHTVGTPAYMAPEQATGGQTVDGRADLYSLGVVLYQMVTGRVPFEGSTPQVLHAHVYDPPPPPSTVADVSPAMEAIILRALAKDVSDRFQTGAAMAQALTQLDDQTRVQVRIMPTAAKIKSARARRWGLIGAIALFIILLATAGIWQFRDFMFNAPVEVTATLAALPVSVTSTTPLPPSTPPPSPTITLSPSPSPSPIAVAQNTPTATVSPPPVATATPSPQPTPSSPPFPTPIPSLTATVCPQPLDEALATLANTILDEPLGCPRSPAIITPAAWQPFEHGLMLWREDLNLIYGVGPGEAWFITGDQWREGDAPYDPAIIVPAGYYQPVRGFGKVWRDRPGVRTALGWGLAEETGFMTTIQEFTGGQVWYDAERDRFMILFNSGAYQLVESIGASAP
ncbi:MAG: serine/threonine protein kinase [Anaerolineae bacterium]|nr:serine/threonine protein kinase [Anaerolineae bacterium]